jgi:precorrin-6B methylase 2
LDILLLLILACPRAKKTGLKAGYVINIQLFTGDYKMKKLLYLTLASMVLFAGCSKSEPEPVIVNVSDDNTESHPIPEVLSTDFNNIAEGKSDAVGIDVKSEEESKEVEKEPDVIFVPTPNDVVARMLEMANVQKDDLLYDLGCGDGRIVVAAAKRYGCRAFGFDVDPRRIKESLDNVKRNDVGDLVTIEKKDIFTLDLSEASVITLYLLPSLNVRLIPQLEKLRPGSRIVSHDFSMKGVKPEKVVRMLSVEDDNEHTVYLWTTPLKKIKEQAAGDEESEHELDSQFLDLPEL